MRPPAIRHRVTAGFALLLTMFLTLVVLQMVAGERLGAEQARRAGTIQRVRDLNRVVLQRMTDAETGVRGFQLTGEKTFLEPYDSGRATTSATLDALAAGAGDADLRALVAAERQAVTQWLYTYAVPVVNAGVADADTVRAGRGKAMFDALRSANADVDAAAEVRLRAAATAARAEIRRLELVFGALAVLVLLTGLGIARAHQRHLLRPLEDIRSTLRRLTKGDLAARATPAGPAEMQALAGSLNGLASRTQRLIAAEQARAAGSELLRAVAVELQQGERGDDPDPAAAGERIADLIAAAFGAGTVHCVFTDEVPALDPAVVGAVRAGTTVVRPGLLAEPVRGDSGPAGLICVERPGRPVWTGEERALLAALAGEVGHAVRRYRLRVRQDRLIGELRTLDEQKSVFVATVTHELRTPLTSILGYCEVLDEDATAGLGAAQRRGLEAIRRNALRLQATVGDLLLLDDPGVRAGDEPVPVDLAAVAATLHGDLSGPVRAKDLHSELSAEPAWVRGDGARLERALRCLLDNAIKFTPAGGRLECRLTADRDLVVVAVTDSGIGIPAGDVPGLFTPFHRAANAMDLAVQGNGLGLAIVRAIVTEHGGTVDARSELGLGSTFTMTLPAADPSTPGRESTAAR